jgi:hypothetical protein
VRYCLPARRVHSVVAAVAVCGALEVSAHRAAVRVVPAPVGDPERIVEGLGATSAREARLVESFATSKTFTINHEGQTRARVVAALTFTAPDVKAFNVLESGGSDFMRTRIIDRMMAAEVELARGRSRARAAITPDNYRFGTAHEDGDAYVIEVEPLRQEEVLFKGRVWITKDGFHLARMEGELAKNPSFWIRRIRFASEFVPVNGVWMQVSTVATVSMRLLGEYVLISTCGPYVISLASDAVAK